MYPIDYNDVKTDDYIAVKIDNSWYLGYAYVNNVKWNDKLYKTITSTLVCDKYPFEKEDEILVNPDDEIYFIENESDLTAMVI